MAVKVLGRSSAIVSPGLFLFSRAVFAQFAMQVFVDELRDSEVQQSVWPIMLAEAFTCVMEFDVANNVSRGHVCARQIEFGKTSHIQ